MKELLNKIIKNIFISEGESHIKFILSDNSEMIYATNGDCCSETWFSDFTGIDCLINEEIFEIEELELPYDGEMLLAQRSRQEEDKLYGYCFKTQKGYATLEYRNSSNGYYGGSCGLIIPKPDDLDPYYKGLYNDYQKKKNEIIFHEIKDDWSA